MEFPLTWVMIGFVIGVVLLWWILGRRGPFLMIVLAMGVMPVKTFGINNYFTASWWKSADFADAPGTDYYGGTLSTLSESDQRQTSGGYLVDFGGYFMGTFPIVMRTSTNAFVSGADPVMGKAYIFVQEDGGFWALMEGPNGSVTLFGERIWSEPDSFVYQSDGVTSAPFIASTHVGGSGHVSVGITLDGLTWVSNPAATQPSTQPTTQPMDIPSTRPSSDVVETTTWVGEIATTMRDLEVPEEMEWVKNFWGDAEVTTPATDEEIPERLGTVISYFKDTGDWTGDESGHDYYLGLGGSTASGGEAVFASGGVLGMLQMLVEKWCLIRDKLGTFYSFVRTLVTGYLCWSFFCDVGQGFLAALGIDAAAFFAWLRFDGINIYSDFEDDGAKTDGIYKIQRPTDSIDPMH